MITQINSINKDEYDKLFEDAVKDLANTYQNQYEEIQLNENTYISNVFYTKNDDGTYTKAIGDYNAGITYYQLLIPEKINTLPEYFSYIGNLSQINSKYVVLPLDEPYFKINANTRVIEIPKEFKQNGVGVQGDHGAEILYFKIARFFDAIDFGRSDISIIIQWETTDKEKPFGSSIAIYKDITSDPDNVIFGWELNNDITKSGSVKFSVRILRWTDNNTKIEYDYSFSTLSANIAINPALQLEGNFLTPDTSVEDNIKNRIINSSTPTSALKLSSPIFIYPNQDIILDLINNNGKYDYTLAACAYPTPQGLVEYEWYQNKIKFSDGGIPFVALTDKNEYNENITYYIQDVNGKYSVYPIDNIDEDINVNEDGSISPVLYYKEGQVTIDTAGTYTVKAQSRGGNFASSDIIENQYSWIVPGPKPIELTDNSLKYKIGTNLLELDETCDLETDDVSTIIKEDIYHGFSYEWIFNNKKLNNSEQQIILKNATKEQQGEYTVNITGKRNNVYTEPISKNYILLFPAVIPTISADRSVQDSWRAGETLVITTNLSEDSCYQLNEYTEPTYTWYKINNTISPNNINSILNNSNISKEQQVIEINGLLQYCDVITNNNEYKNEFTPENSGYYFCKVTNKYGIEDNTKIYYSLCYTAV